MNIWKPLLLISTALKRIALLKSPTLKRMIFGCFLISHVTFAATELDRVAIIVNKGVILQSDINNAFYSFKAHAQNSGQPLPNDEILQQQVVEKLIIDTIQLQEAERIGVRIDDNMLNEAINSIAKNNKQTPAQLQASAEREGLSYAEFREQIRKEVAINEARGALVRNRINILPAEVNNLAKLLAQENNQSVQYQISHIQLRFNDDDKAEIEQQAKELIEQLKQGADFKTMAYSYSKGPKALQGGDWGWMRKEEMPTIFADQIIAQGKDSIIGPFNSEGSIHILKIEDTKGLENVATIEVNARHILIKTSVILSDEGARRELERFITQINAKKATFGELAELYSQDPGSAAQYGELGYQIPDLYVPEFRHQVETLPIGKISAPFKTAHGWHIVEVLGRREVDKTEATMNNKAYRILFNRKFNEEASAWMQEIRANAVVEIIDNDDSE